MLQLGDKKMHPRSIENYVTRSETAANNAENSNAQRIRLGYLNDVATHQSLALSHGNA